MDAINVQLTDIQIGIIIFVMVCSYLLGFYLNRKHKKNIKERNREMHDL